MRSRKAFAKGFHTPKQRRTPSSELNPILPIGATSLRKKVQEIVAGDPITKAPCRQDQFWGRAAALERAPQAKGVPQLRIPSAPALTNSWHLAPGLTRCQAPLGSAWFPKTQSSRSSVSTEKKGRGYGEARPTCSAQSTEMVVPERPWKVCWDLAPRRRCSQRSSLKVFPVAVKVKQHRQPAGGQGRGTVPRLAGALPFRVIRPQPSRRRRASSNAQKLEPSISVKAAAMDALPEPTDPAHQSRRNSAHGAK